METTRETLNLYSNGETAFDGTPEDAAVTLDFSALDGGFSLPGEADLAREIGKNIDPDAIFAAREALAASIAKISKAAFERLYASLQASGSFSPDAASAGRRAGRCGACRSRRNIRALAAAELLTGRFGFFGRSLGFGGNGIKLGFLRGSVADLGLIELGLRKLQLFGVRFQLRLRDGRGISLRFGRRGGVVWLFALFAHGENCLPDTCPALCGNVLYSRL